MYKVVMTCTITFVKSEKHDPSLAHTTLLIGVIMNHYPSLPLTFDFYTEVMMGHCYSFQGVPSGKYLHQNFEIEQFLTFVLSNTL